MFETGHTYIVICSGRVNLEFAKSNFYNQFALIRRLNLRLLLVLILQLYLHATTGLHREYNPNDDINQYINTIILRKQSLKCMRVKCVGQKMKINL